MIIASNPSDDGGGCYRGDLVVKGFGVQNADE